MNAEDDRVGRLLLLGDDYPEYGTAASTRVGSLAAAAISVGSDPRSPSRQFKLDTRAPNEDALCVMEAGDWAGYAVADAHYGPESSHTIISRLHDMWARIRPDNLEHLAQMVEFLRHGEPAQTESETTLLIVNYDRVERVGFGISFGDSSFVVAGPGRRAEPRNPVDGRFVSPHFRSSFTNGSAFRFDARPGDMLLTYTDGIDQCHYRRPETSVRPEHVATIVEHAGGDPLAVVDRLMSLALTGVDGNPGGQDNVALIAASA